MSKVSFRPHSDASMAEYASYFRYFQWAVSLLAWPDGTGQETQFHIRTYQDLIKITRCMELLSDLDCSQMAEKVKSGLLNSLQCPFL